MERTLTVSFAGLCLTACGSASGINDAAIIEQLNKNHVADLSIYQSIYLSPFVSSFAGKHMVVKQFRNEFTPPDKPYVLSTRSCSSLIRFGNQFDIFGKVFDEHGTYSDIENAFVGQYNRWRTGPFCLMVFNDDAPIRFGWNVSEADGRIINRNDSSYAGFEIAAHSYGDVLDIVDIDAPGCTKRMAVELRVRAHISSKLNPTLIGRTVGTRDVCLIRSEKLGWKIETLNEPVWTVDHIY